MFYFFLAQITSSGRSLHSFCNIKLKYLPKHCKQRHYIALFRLHKILCTVCRSNTTTDTQTQVDYQKCNIEVYFFLNRKNILHQNSDHAPLIIETVILSVIIILNYLFVNVEIIHVNILLFITDVHQEEMKKKLT